MELIPSLPQDMARQCLIRVSYDQFPTLLSTCRGWKTEIQSPEYFHQRKVSGCSQKLVFMAQARVVPESKHDISKDCPVRIVYVLSVLEPGSGKWVDLPLPDEFVYGLPIFCQLVVVGFDLVVMGGSDPVTWEAKRSVFLFNFLTGKWRRGADMPGLPRSFFGCASGYGKVFVAGGHDGEKNALKSAMAYDTANDEWTPLPEMAIERDECKGVFLLGKFHVIGGYRTDTQGQFETSAEVFDAATWKWDGVRDDFLKASTCPRTCTGGDDVNMYMIHDSDVIVLKDNKWRVIANVPDDVCKVAYMRTWQNELFVIGCLRSGGSHNAYVLNLKKSVWTRLENPEKYWGAVHSGCYLEI